MTKIGLRDWILLITLVPTLFISLGLGGYFSFARYQDVQHYLEEQASNIAEPLAIASEEALLYNNKTLLQRLVNLSHRKNSPLVKSIAIFDRQHQLVVTSNYHKDFARLTTIAEHPWPDHSEILDDGKELIILVPVLPEQTDSDSPAAQSPALGLVLLELQKDKVLLAQQSSLLVSLLIILLGMMVGLALSLKLVGRLTTPMQQLISLTEKLAEGRYASKLEQPYFGELDQMRLGINQLATQLKELQDEMQHTIEQSTSDLTHTMEQLEMQNVALDMARRKAQEDNKLKSEFLAKMSHELRTPLNGVIGFTRQLLKTQLSHHQQDYLNTIQKSANSLLTLVNDVLDYAKLEEGRMPINPEPFSLRDLVNDSIELLAANAFEKQLELALLIDPDCPDDIIGDPLRINQVLMNIAGNAVKFTEHGSIVIRVSGSEYNDDKTLLHFSVQDTGIGIPQEQQEQLFYGFSQADGSIGRRYGGTGLGLFISQRLVEAMGGSIGFDSQPDQGSTFWFTVSCRRHPLPVSEVLPVQLLAGKTVLYIEPQQFSREATLSLLNSWGMQVSSCATPSQVQQALASQSHYDMAIIGRAVSLDQVNQIVELIRQLNQSCSYIYLLVNTLSPTLREALLQTGAQACLSKPAHQRKLAAALARPYQQLHELPGKLPAPPKSKLRVLTVDDNEANLKLINALLGELVESIDSATNGAEALQKASQFHYDVIFMDINMPVMDGITACQRIQQSSINEATPIIAVTAHALEGERERLMLLGFSEFLSKPLDEQMLHFALKECCAHAGLAPERDPEQLLQELPKSRHLDWELALRCAAGKVDLAKELLQILLGSLPATLTEMESLMRSKQVEPLIQLVHKLHGASCYTGVPHIKQLTELIETELKHGKTIEQLEPELFELQDRLQSLLAEAAGWVW
ncbi:two-component sensor histidine kinase BarA [Rheinheimera sp. 4Y26]|uniref:two-component sensor histidine kinase BarA n=1 Tax=Rheinheimera sp. 4Y26 TaxID=2977811 RepID=UPI0021B11975|nr:two-component sensor histidine kinase BarA [Rheinheimera sp. 4Y26]MCT6698994.1 two-component sensor histidine kinase BarA [Rheinheimera sp. 4Y26]